jgi:hypothetical protein
MYIYQCSLKNDSDSDRSKMSLKNGKKRWQYGLLNYVCICICCCIGNCQTFFKCTNMLCSQMRNSFASFKGHLYSFTSELVRADTENTYCTQKGIQIKEWYICRYCCNIQLHQYLRKTFIPLFLPTQGCQMVYLCTNHTNLNLFFGALE